MQACFREFGRELRHGISLDFRLDDDIARDPHNFMDSAHYRSNVARLLEGRIAEALRRAAIR